MKALIISSDTSLLSPDSPAYEELLRASFKVDELSVIVFTEKSQNFPYRKVSEKLTLYPTNSRNRLFFLFDANKIIRKNLVENGDIKADIVISNDSFGAMFAASRLASRYKKYFLVNLFKNVFAGRERNIFSRSLRNTIYRKILLQTDGIRVPTQLIGELLYNNEPTLEKKIYVLPQVKRNEKEIDAADGVSDIHKKYPQFNITFVAASQGFLVKDLKRLLTMMHVLHGRYPKAGLIIAGEILDRSWHPLLIKKLPVYVVLEKKAEEIIPYYSTISAFVDISDRKEPSEPILQAAFSGCPIVASALAAGSVVHNEENGFIIPTNDPHLCARKVIDILETPGLRERIHLFKYDITNELYDNNIDEYDARLVDIWEKCSTNPQENHAEQPVIKTSGKYVTFTLDTVRKISHAVTERFDKKVPRHRYIDRLESEAVFNVDAVRRTEVKEALKELEQSGELDEEAVIQGEEEEIDAGVKISGDGKVVEDESVVS